MRYSLHSPEIELHRMNMWEIPPDTPVLPNDEVHLWSIALNQPPVDVEHLAQTLHADEQQRATRFVFERDRRRFIVGRGMLRLILSRYLGSAPATLTFNYGAHGKPALTTIHSPGASAGTSAMRDDTQALRFNLSHSHEHALYAVTRDREVGVDLEYLRPMQDMLHIAQRYFCVSEHGILQSLSANEQLVTFFAAWTSKEACLKARGDGLACALDQVEVSLQPGEPIRLLNIAGDANEAARWSLQTIIPIYGYIAALVVEGHSHITRCWQW